MKLLLLSLSFFTFIFLVKTNEDAFLTVPELITKYGYPLEIHQVTTPDNYILTLYRISHRKNSTTISKRIVYLQHGLLSSSAEWIFPGPSKALGYLLTDEGYDVWMGNARGTRYSRQHKYLNPDTSREFWNFSWEEIGYYDLPTSIDHVLETTGEKKLFYIGMSQGTTTFYVMTSMRPDYNKKIKAQFSLAPVAFMDHISNPFLRSIAILEDFVKLFIEIFGLYEVFSNNNFKSLLTDSLCSDGKITQSICSLFLFANTGYNQKELNTSSLSVLLNHCPTSASVKQILHYCQEIKSGHFRRYDYGKFGNKAKYGLPFPPNYNLSAITAPVYLFYSLNDWLSNETDVNRLHTKLPNCKGKFLVADKEFNHGNFIHAINIRFYLYDKLISVMSEYP